MWRSTSFTLCEPDFERVLAGKSAANSCYESTYLGANQPWFLKYMEYQGNVRWRAVFHRRPSMEGYRFSHIEIYIP